MSRHLPTTRRFRVFLAVVPLSLISAIPVLSQPLGLSDAWRDSSTQPKSQIQSTASSADSESQLDTQPLLPEPSEVRPPVDAPVETGVFFDEMGDLHDLLITRGKNPILTPKLPLTAGDDGVEEDEEEEEEDEDDAVIFEKPNGILVEQIIFEDVHYNLYITAGPLNIRSGPSKTLPVSVACRWGTRLFARVPAKSGCALTTMDVTLMSMPSSPARTWFFRTSSKRFMSMSAL